ncbi:MAG: response regulator [Deltaproteobacteria bacterium]|nr:response regulator [Deltaproteobacteria bacterium]
MSRKLLLADDSITIQKVIQIIFAHEDYELTITDNGDSALTQAHEIKPDLVIADISMPGKNGYELCDAIKHTPDLQDVPVLLLAGSFEPFDEGKAREVQADSWIEKPFESQALLDQVAELLKAKADSPSMSAPFADTLTEATLPSDISFSEELEPLEDTEPETLSDPFADISFDEEQAAQESGAAGDDWLNLSESVDTFAQDGTELETEFEQTSAYEDSDFAIPEEPLLDTTEPESASDALLDQETRESDTNPEFSSEDEATDESETMDYGFADLDDEDEEILALGDEDILDMEDLEPLAEEPTLKTWTRDALPGEDVEPLSEGYAGEPDLAMPSADHSEFADIAEGAVDKADEEAWQLPEHEDLPTEVDQEPPLSEFDSSIDKPAFVQHVEDKVVALSDQEIEAIVERVAGQVVETLAASIIEKVTWEVVPDLAESLIREEIRKIKDSAA